MQATATPGFQPPPPSPDGLVAWPEAFGNRFTIFVDAEEEFDWGLPFRRDGYGTAAIAALPDAHRRFAERGVTVGYLIDYPLASESGAIDLLHQVLAIGLAEIGTQLHPWVNPPFEEVVDVPNSFAGNLPQALEAAKLDALTAAITRAFGRAPRVYRAGRYGLGSHTLRLLAARGYLIDTSMRARHDYSGEQGPNYRTIGNHAFRTGPHERVLELPLTTVYTGLLRGLGDTLHRGLGQVARARGVAARLRFLDRVALTPEGTSVSAALEAVRVGVGEGVRVLNLSYHSPSLVPGHTPYVRDAADLRDFWLWWERVLNLLDRLGVRPASVDDLLRASASRPLAAA